MGLAPMRKNAVNFRVILEFRPVRKERDGFEPAAVDLITWKK